MQILPISSERATYKRLTFSQSATICCSSVAKVSETATSGCSLVAIRQLGLQSDQYEPKILSDADKLALVNWMLSLVGRSLEDLRFRSRKTAIAKDRAIFSTVLHLKYGLHLPFLGVVLKRNHASVVNHCKTVYKQLYYKEFFKNCCQLEEALNAVHSGKGNLFLSSNQISTYYDKYRIR
jgi:hypothetical protein